MLRARQSARQAVQSWDADKTVAIVLLRGACRISSWKRWIARCSPPWLKRTKRRSAAGRLKDPLGPAADRRLVLLSHSGEQRAVHRFIDDEMRQTSRSNDGDGLIGIPTFDRLPQRFAECVTSLHGGLGRREIGIEKNRHQWNRLRRCHKATHDEVKSMADAAIREAKCECATSNCCAISDLITWSPKSASQGYHSGSCCWHADMPARRKAGIFSSSAGEFKDSRPNRHSRRAYGLRETFRDGHRR